MNVWSARGLVFGVLFAAALAAGSSASALTPTPSNTPEPPTTPVPAGTPWPAPDGVKLIGRAILLDDNNFPIPPDKQSWFAGLRWDVLEGFTGNYDVQRAVRPQGSAALDWGTIQATVPASAAVAGVIEFEEPIPVFSVFCYRVRMVINGQTGPYSEAACMAAPPSSGGVDPGTPVLPPPTATIEPGPRGLSFNYFVDLFDERGDPLPPEARIYTAEVTWPVPFGYQGAYQLEHDERSAPWQPPFLEPFDFAPAHSGVLSASAAVDGQMHFSERIDPSNIYCYRIRTVENGQAGPFSLPACNFGSHGGPNPSEPIPRPPRGAAPLPPDAGNTSNLTNDRGWPVAAGLFVAATLATMAALARRRR